MTQAQWGRRWLDYYDVLGLEFGASHEEVAEAYKSKVWLFHPDAHRDKSAKVQDQATREFTKLQEAHECLHDADLRYAYDRAWLARNLQRHLSVTPTQLDLGNPTSGDDVSVSFAIESTISIATDNVGIRVLPKPPFSEDSVLDIVVTKDGDTLFPLRVDLVLATDGLLPGDVWTEIQVDFDFEDEAL